MTDGLPELVWPNLILPNSAVPVIYLDLNHWIYLAQAAAGKRPGEQESLTICRTARARGTAFFVLSTAHYFEMQKINDPAQRAAIADVMEELSGFSSLLGRDIVMRYELHAALDIITQAPVTLPRLCLLGWGFSHAFMGQPLDLEIVGRAEESSNEALQRYGISSESRMGHFTLERALLTGPKDHELENLRSHGYKPEFSLNVGETRALEEQQQRKRLNENPAWRKGRLRDVVAAREWIIEFQNILPRALAERRLHLDDVMRDQKTARWLSLAMPSTRVAIELKTAWHRNRDKVWANNDIYDIDALSVAVPYCDIVVTEKACHHVLSSAGLDKRMRSALLRRLRDLPGALQQWMDSDGNSHRMKKAWFSV